MRRLLELAAIAGLLTAAVRAVRGGGVDYFVEGDRRRYLPAVLGPERELVAAVERMAP